jgi:N-acetylmuramoyl-L-alanine amidase
MRASLAFTAWLASRYRIALSNVIGHAESLTSPYHHERYQPWRCQTHGDWQHASMQQHRAQLRRLLIRKHAPLGTRQERATPNC